MYCILETFTSPDGLPVDICEERGSTGVHIRIAGGTICGIGGARLAAFDYLVALERWDLIEKYALNPWRPRQQWQGVVTSIS